jgi:hypothetical protein
MSDTSQLDQFTPVSRDALAEEEARLNEAYAKAMAEYGRLQAKAEEEDKNLSEFEDYSIHEVPGVGRYVIMRQQGWAPLINIISNDNDPKSVIANIDFSPRLYPLFDGVIGDRFQSPYLLDPTDDNFESYKDLRDNIAAVRNFLMQTYYANTPEGMTGEKAQQSLKEIALFVGDGLYNNWLLFNFLRVHDPREPHISIDEASRPNGKGAQYIYEKILEMQRHSNWMRPFAPIASLFGGKPIVDWHLPPASETHFNEKLGDFASIDAISPETEIALQTASAQLVAIGTRLNAVRDQRMVSNVAVDLDAIGNHLAFTAMQMDSVKQLDAGIRQEAVDIARDILRKLKLAIGNFNLLDGLKLKPSDDVAALGAVKGVAVIYERLLGWARANHDGDIFRHPSVMAATQAIGQLGYQAKREALRMATLAGNGSLIDAIQGQMGRLPQSYANPTAKTFGELFDTIERGMNTILNRTQQVGVSGGKVGFTVESQQGSSMSAAPPTGVANTRGVEGARASTDAARAAAQAQLLQANQKLAAQLAQAEQRRQQATSRTAAGTEAAASTSRSTVGRQAAPAQSTREQKAKTEAAASAANPAASISAAQASAQQQAALQSAQMAETARRRENEQRQQSNQQQQQAQRDTAARSNQMAMRNATAAMQQAMRQVPSNVGQATNLSGIAPGAQPITGGRVDPRAIQEQARRAIAQAQASAAAAAKPQAARPAASTATPQRPDLPPPTPPIPGQPNRQGRGI